MGACEVLGERELLVVLALLSGHDDLGHPLAEPQCRLDRVREAPLDRLLADEPVHHHLDRVLLVAGELERGALGELDDLAVDADPGVALLGQLVEQARVLALATPDDWGEHLEAGPVGQLHDAVDDLLWALASDEAPAARAVGLTDAGVQQAEVVVDLGHGADRRARVAGGGLLVDRDCRRETLDEVHVRLVHLAEELPRVGRQRLDVSPLALGVDGVEGERRLARAREAGQHDQPVAWQVDREVLQVVLARPANHKHVRHLSAHLP